MANIDSKYNSFIHFTIKSNSKDYSILFNSKFYLKIWIWLYSIQQNIHSFRKPGYRRPLLVRVFAHLQLDLGSRHVDLRGAWAGEVVRISKTSRERTSLRWWSWVLSQLVTEERLRRFAPQVDFFVASQAFPSWNAADIHARWQTHVQQILRK